MTAGRVNVSGGYSIGDMIDVKNLGFNNLIEGEIAFKEKETFTVSSLRNIYGTDTAVFKLQLGIIKVYHKGKLIFSGEGDGNLFAILPEKDTFYNVNGTKITAYNLNGSQIWTVDVKIELAMLVPLEDGLYCRTANLGKKLVTYQGVDMGEPSVKDVPSSFDNRGVYHDGFYYWSPNASASEGNNYKINKYVRTATGLQQVATRSIPYSVSIAVMRIYYSVQKGKLFIYSTNAYDRDTQIDLVDLNLTPIYSQSSVGTLLGFSEDDYVCMPYTSAVVEAYTVNFRPIETGTPLTQFKNRYSALPRYFWGRTLWSQESTSGTQEFKIYPSYRYVEITG
ncbi:hypothetical protein [uncultured Clostridium sp.]|uniref:hypothetical protein n=1 Tax=uncultured Clostridium sp. TaxID=59620 RepID=UPI002588DB49|nr:hypothetical protein [uncultured Clostridium sp.]MDU1348258.1 hypothetical protein [Clostridium argentinense]